MQRGGISANPAVLVFAFILGSELHVCSATVAGTFLGRRNSSYTCHTDPWWCSRFEDAGFTDDEISAIGWVVVPGSDVGGIGGHGHWTYHGKSTCVGMNKLGLWCDAETFVCGGPGHSMGDPDEGVISMDCAEPQCNIGAGGAQVHLVRQAIDNYGMHPSCNGIDCTDNPSPWMLNRGKDCPTAYDVRNCNKCFRHADWVEGQFCQLSCYVYNCTYQGVKCHVP